MEVLRRRKPPLPSSGAPAIPQPTTFRRDKLVLARILARTPWHGAARAVERRLGLIRVFNTHSTPRRYAASFGRQLDHLLARYEPLNPYRLEEVLELGPSGRRPLAVFTFDDGFRNHFEVAAAELEKRGARGIFSIPADFLSVPEGKQVQWCRRRIRYSLDVAEHAQDEDLLAMSWDQARELVARGHRICCHTLSHEVLSARTSRQTLEVEVVESRQRLEDELGVPVDGFCWPVEFDPRATAAVQLVRSTYAYALVTDTRALRKGNDPFNVFRTRFEASWPLEALDLHTSGIIDGAHLLRRVRGSLAR